MSEKKLSPEDRALVQQVLDGKLIRILFQPVISISTKRILGFEAFSEGRSPDGAASVSPELLFSQDLEPVVQVGVDRLCRALALGQFRSIQKMYEEMLLFTNVNVNILKFKEADPAFLFKQVRKSGIPMQNIVAEIPFGMLDMISDEIIRFYRSHGFKLCINDLGVDDPFLATFSRVRPDMVKLNRTFFAEDEASSYRSRVLEGLLSFAGSSGFMVIGQCVESRGESVRLLRAGVDVQQGYYYTKEESASLGSEHGQDPVELFFGKIDRTYRLFRARRKKEVGRIKRAFGLLQNEYGEIAEKVARVSERDFDPALHALIGNTGQAVSMFILSEQGIQLTGRAHVSVKGHENGSSRNGVKGMDHSMRDYCIYMEVGYDRFVTKPFTSPYTGQEAVIIARSFNNMEDGRFILCVEMPHPH